jgi:hypothetical protein
MTHNVVFGNTDVFFTGMDLVFTYLFSIELVVNLTANWYTFSKVIYK